MAQPIQPHRLGDVLPFFVHDPQPALCWGAADVQRLDLVRALVKQFPNPRFGLLGDLDEVMTNTSLCALGGLAMNPVRSTMEKWPDAFPERVDLSTQIQ